MNKNITLADYSFYVLRLVVFLIPFNTFYNNYLLAIFAILAILDKRFWRDYSFKKQSLGVKLLLSAIIIFILLNLVGAIYSENIRKALVVLRVRISFFILPFIFLGLRNVQLPKKSILWSFVLGVVAYSVVCYVSATLQSFRELDGVYGFYPNVWHSTQRLSFIEAVFKRYNYYSYSWLSWHNHPSYSSLFVAFAIISVYYLFKTDRNKQKRYLYYSLMFYLSFFEILLMTRTGLISLIFVWAFIISLEVIKFKRRTVAIYGIIGILAAGILFMKETRLLSNIKDLSEAVENKNIDKAQKYDDRIYIWYASLKSIQYNFLFGTGLGDAEDEMAKVFNKLGLNKFANIHFNAHNQFLDTFVRLGLIGFLAISFYMLTAFVIAFRRNSLLLLSLVSLMFIYFMFESMLVRVSAIIFVSIFLNMFVFTDSLDKET